MVFYSNDEKSELEKIRSKKDSVDFKKLDSYFEITAEALQKVEDAGIEGDNAKDFWVMAVSYFNDAKHFAFEKKDFVLSYGALNYAHAWLDAGARIGLFDVNDSRLFTVDD